MCAAFVGKADANNRTQGGRKALRQLCEGLAVAGNEVGIIYPHTSREN